MQLRDFGRSWGFGIAMPYPCYWMPKAVLLLIAMKQWNALLVLHQHMLGLPMQTPCPPQPWITSLGSRLRSRVTATPELSRRVAATTAALFRANAKRALSDVSEELRPGQQMQYERATLVMDGPVEAYDGKAELSSGHKFSGHPKLFSVLAAMHL